MRSGGAEAYTSDNLVSPLFSFFYLSNVLGEGRGPPRLSQPNG